MALIGVSAALQFGQILEPSLAQDPSQVGPLCE